MVPSGPVKLPVLLASLLLALPWPAGAHEVRPGYLDLREAAIGRYHVVWKQPALGDLRLRIDPVFPADCRLEGERIRQPTAGAYLDRMTLLCPGGLAGRTITVAGLEATLTDALVRVQLLDGRTQTELLKAGRPRFTVTGGGTSGAASYLALGIQHILLGFDHLLFVLGLLLLVSGRWVLFQTVTAFTVGHSASLALATLGLVEVPAPPLNAAIALSIVFLAAEIVRAGRGQRHLAARRPWLVAGAFGLLHGLGFASALTALGLPASAVPLALLLFNLGVEAGQVLFVAVVLALRASWRLLEVPWPSWARPLPAYAMGIVAAVWFAGRLSLLITG